MKKGDVYEVFLDPTLGSEQSGRRPVVIISGDLANTNLNTVIVVPFTTKLKKYHNNLILNPNKKNGLSKKSEAMPIHIRSLAKERLKVKIGTLTVSEMNKIIDGLEKILKY